MTLYLSSTEKPAEIVEIKEKNYKYTDNGRPWSKHFDQTFCANALLETQKNVCKKIWNLWYLNAPRAISLIQMELKQGQFKFSVLGFQDPSYMRKLLLKITN